MTTKMTDSCVSRLLASRRGVAAWSVAFWGALLVPLGHARAAGTAGGPLTWVKPDPATRTLTLKSSLPGVSLKVTDPETGEELNTPEKLYERGWVVTSDGSLQSRMDGFYETIPLFDQAGQPLRIEVSGLYPGVHEAALQYFAQPMEFGSSWGFYSRARLGSDGKWQSMTSSAPVVRGIGGLDKSTIYQQTLGTLGTPESPADQMVVMFAKAMWSKQATFHGLRISTSPSMTAPLTGMNTEAERRIRKHLEEFGPTAEDGKKAYFAAAIPAAVKVKPKSFASLKPEYLKSSASLAGARNESEHFQILLYHPEEELTAVEYSVETLSGPANTSPDGVEITVAPVGYVAQKLNPYDIQNYGFLPDPILTFMDSVTVAAGDAQTLWVRADISAHAKPGTYRGAITLKPHGKPAHTIPLELEVWDIELPKMPFLPVVTGVGKQTDFELEYGINPSTIYGRSVFAKEDEEALAILKEWKSRGATAINLAYVTYRDRPAPPKEELEKWVDGIERNYELAKQAGLEEEAYLYMFDEAKTSDYPAMRTVAKALKSRMPNLRLMTTAYWGENLDFGVNAGVPIDIWVPIVQHFRNPILADIGRGHGRDVWWYTCNSPPSPMPNILLNNPAMETRMLMGLMAHAFRVEGFLYYKTADWKHRKPITDGPYTGWVLRTGYAHGNWYYKTTDNKPLPSIRLENFKDGLEDYDLIEIAFRLQNQMKKAGQPVDTPTGNMLDNLKTVPNAYVKSILDYCREPERIETLRRELAKFILAAKRLQ